MMTNVFLNELAVALRKAGAAAVEFYVLRKKSGDIGMYNGVIESVTESDEHLIYVECDFNGQLGTTYIEMIDATKIPQYIVEVKQSAAHNGIEYEKKPFEKNADNTFEMLPPCGAEIALLSGYEAAMAIDSHVMGAMGIVHYEHNIITLANDSGASMTESSGFVSVSLSATAKEGAMMNAAHESAIAHNLDDININEMAETAAQTAVFTLKPERVTSAAMKAILRGDVVAELLSTFLPVFYADKVIKKTSLVADKVGEQIGISSLTIIEEPTLPYGKVQRTFDDEGTPIMRKAIIENGVLLTLLHNNSTAKKLNASSTGNGFKKSYKENTSISTTNICIEAGDMSLEQIIADIGEGILITGIEGLHSGINVVSGDFSLLASGITIEGGKTSRAVSQFTITGNLLSMLDSITAISRERISTPRHMDYLLAPSLALSSLSVSGEN